MNFRNFKMVDYMVYGKGCFAQLDAILAPHRMPNAPIVFFLDHYFDGDNAMKARIPLRDNDVIISADVTHEPKTGYIDELADHIKSTLGTVSGIVGIGGGSTLDIAKAVSIMMTNPGKAQDYQGWDLVKNKAVYKVGIPTLSGTGAEVSRTTVLTGPTRKLGMNSDFTPFNQIVLDPELIANAPSHQRFYTGMDCFIHCVESLTGTYINQFSRSYGEKAQALCEEVFLHEDAWTAESDEKLMMASYAGGMSIAYSQVGVAHAISYGLSYLLGTKHGIGNCIVFNHLHEFYPQGVDIFHKMVDKHNIPTPQGICASLSDQDIETMMNVSLGLAPLWENALGTDWKNLMTADRLYSLYRKL
ncbi:MAG: iron-containing alcohol dehydrogenase [Chitinophagia bacterium]|nr:iron-containing alcohol dehydrogenase [Chitinophagia bacterium]